MEPVKPMLPEEFQSLLEKETSKMSRAPQKNNLFEKEGAVRHHLDLQSRLH
jgi:hypothetical protein